MITLNVQRTHDEEQFSVRGGCGRGIEISRNLKVMCGEGEERKEDIKRNRRKRKLIPDFYRIWYKLFANNMKVSAASYSNKDQRNIQHLLPCVFEWVSENGMKHEIFSTEGLVQSESGVMCWIHYIRDLEVRILIRLKK